MPTGLGLRKKVVCFAKWHALHLCVRKGVLRNMLIHIHANLLENQFLPIIVQAKYNIFVVFGYTITQFAADVFVCNIKKPRN